ncbi:MULTISPECIES: hypothetical protein [Bacillaceae]|uniref:Uncharacterized protein n=1 Tax=Evansella alkalicola TaxID=745819 RepID=A0ABS6JPX7_9BACI|nr:MULTISPECIES: hypothetical protein [Bacillaceae]MBU9720543.1 hypothetical protein [Bacillus alkalicola]
MENLLDKKHIKTILVISYFLLLFSCSTESSADVREEVYVIAGEVYQSVSDFYYEEEMYDLELIQDMRSISKEIDDITEDEEKLFRVFEDICLGVIMLNDGATVEDLELIDIYFEDSLQKAKNIIEK